MGERPKKEARFSLEDYQIVNLYWQRSENAIVESDRKYGKLLKKISFSLLNSNEDAEECVNDTYTEAWNRMPEDRPAYLGAYLSKIVRCLSINRFRALKRQKRGGYDTIIEELTECIPSNGDIFGEFENGRLKDTLNRFVATLDTEKRVIFLRRYFYSESVSDIAESLNVSESKVKTVLFRARQALKKALEKEELI